VKESEKRRMFKEERKSIRNAYPKKAAKRKYQYFDCRDWLKGVGEKKKKVKRPSQGDPGRRLDCYGSQGSKGKGEKRECGGNTLCRTQNGKKFSQVSEKKRGGG